MKKQTTAVKVCGDVDSRPPELTSQSHPVRNTSSLKHCCHVFRISAPIGAENDQTTDDRVQRADLGLMSFIDETRWSRSASVT